MSVMLRRSALAALCLALATGCDGSRHREVSIDLQPASTEPASAPLAGRPRPLRFSVAAVESPRDTYGTYTRLLSRVGERLGVPVEFVQRRTYREVNDLLASGQLDAALLCTGGYLDIQRRDPGAVEVLAAPVVHGESTYRSLVIVPAGSPARSLADLAGKRFAFTDELSLSGRAWAVRRLEELGKDPDRFFGGVTFTQSHDRSIAGVASGIVDGAAVHSLVYEHLLERDPALASRVRVVERSPPYGLLPIVASRRLDPAERARLAAALRTLHQDGQAREALERLQIERFIAPPPGLYDSAGRLLDPPR
jgi:phosphonate transport system substrate-binding protein